MLFKLASTVFLAQFFALTSAQTISGPFDCLPAGNSYTLCQNLWGRTSGVGSQSSTLVGSSGDSVSWSTNWNWQNNQNSVKSYANIIADNAMGKQLSAVTSAPTSWSWSYETKSDPIRANVAYDLWLGASPVGAPASRNSSYEIMVWLSRQGGIQPIGGPTASGIQLAGNTWTLWSGPNSNWQVLSFVSDTGDIPNFNADFKEFFDYLVQNSGVSSQQYVQAIQAGTEPFTGSANLVTHSYSVALN
ncbi:hypothetical protein AGABI1DRAFT_115318 [Agaricus bisporus var. burnettii JB137-S8]|uniref:Uncharacterized protein n=1 Tax=Agaricus bisporus var. burnettii (strain JB137-S8 / ATCC MYA-4627 / FGSC 10392) TaxID=597362 RepID=K5VSH7_AGABU|nr:hypothetical protein AGABI2DRAFT_194280 [Agaricus bisporus var. bisporus H97]XP_007332051.1 uncharacterized protein AGABI1DRAFT_115318 [Agaricus bisporus var. burnettii JB137-S8]EKM77414.1 hypothetical protein AGABI1DRAFT_115318 [Agaricus bisporus var. burnettii JB137-S8]EKV45319.1 hypothetical protein AGABI2DRAFT_194280 [Agaricus bisporus var. bisporus H97]